MRMTTLTLPGAPIDGNLSRYFREISRFPLLDADEEYMLAKRWREHGDVAAAQTLVTSHLRLVAKVAMRYRGYGLPLTDLVSEGNIGLMKALRKFEPDYGFRLSTYAVWWIRAAITEYVLRSWSLVKMGTIAAQKKLFFSLRKLKQKMNIVDSRALTSEQSEALAKRLNVSAREVVEMNDRLSARDTSLNAPIAQGGDGSGVEFQDTLVDDTPSPETLVADSQERNVRRALLERALAMLPERERYIFVERRLADEPKTLAELGQIFGISRERIRQLEVRAYEKVKRTIEAEARASA
jgi:RNA polymerase sigma-32 factor